ncbi:unnamed protein product [Bathycoccus prasinos]
MPPPPPLPPPLSTTKPRVIDVLLGVHPAKAEGSVRDATAEHLIEAFEELPKKEQIVMVKKLLRDALREEDEAKNEMVLERAPEVKISKSEADERAMDGTASSSSSSTMNEREILERAVRELPNARPEQRAKAAEILRRLEEETGKVRGEKEEESVSTKNASYDASNSGSSSRLENNRFNDFEKQETEEKDDNPFEDEDIVWDLRSAVASLTTVAKAKLIPPLAFGTGFAALAFVLTKMVGGDDAGNETRDEARMNDESDARISPPPPPPSTIMNDRNDNDAGDIAPPLLPMEEAKRLLFESQAIQPPPVSTTTSKTKKMKKSENRGRGVATNTTSSGGNGNSVLWKRKEENYDALLEAAVEEEDEDIEEPFEDDDDEPERGEEAREMSPPPRKSAASGSTSGGVKKQRRPPPDLTSASFLSEEDREKNFENIRARRVSENGLLLVNYVGKLKDGTVFDTTYGGEIVSTSENSVSVRESETQPVVINLAANAVQPGQVKGLKRGLIGAKRGETREIMVKAEDGFGSSSVVSPLRVRVPAESELFYTVEVLRVSNTGVDDLFKGVSLCSVGVANKTTAGCSDL